MNNNGVVLDIMMVNPPNSKHDDGRKHQVLMPRTGLTGIALAAIILVARASAQDASFTLVATATQPYTPSYLGNGAVSLVTSPLATEPTRSFVAGLYDETPGDVPRIASAAAWNEIDVYNGVHWLNATPITGAIEQYRQELDMHDGVLRTAYRWNDSGKPIELRITQFVSRDNPHLAAVEVTIRPEFSGKIAVRLPLRKWAPPHRYLLARIKKLDTAAQRDPWLIWYPGDVAVSAIVARAPSKSLSLLAAAPGTNQRLGEAVALDWPAQSAVQVNSTAASAEFRLTIDAKRDQSYTFRKFAALITSGESSVRERAVQEAEAARRSGWDALLSASTQAWHDLWQADILIDGDAGMQRIIHSMLFYLLGSVRSDLDISIGPMGLSSAGYYGHIFWDADTFLFPALVILHPELAKPMVAFRSRTLPAAVENARRNGFRGAMFPWEAGPDGQESTPLFAFQNASSENHVNGDIALAAWQYWLATGDRAWLEHDCWPILRDTADFWTSRVTFDSKRGQYVIGHVVAVNESEIGVSNDPYTNAIAQKNLQIAIDAAALLHVQAHPEWKRVADKMFVPESDSALLWFPLNRQYSNQQTRAAIETELNRAQEHRSGAMMGTEFYSILAAQIGDRPAISGLLVPLSVPYLRPPLQVIAETPENQNTNFITGGGAFLQQFVFGFTGLRFTENGVERRFPPVLPPGITRITLRNANIHGQRQTLVFSASRR